jgi:hypothetical protein
MGNRSTGTRFQDLPLELHIIIWDLAIGSTFLPQVFQLQWQSRSPSSADDDSSSSPSSLLNIPLLIPGGDCPTTHFTFQLCRKSRLYAFSKGYQVWSFKNDRGEVRSINWKPTLDVIFLPAHIAAKSILGNARRTHPITVLLNDFPLQSQQIRKLCLRYCVRCRTKKQHKTLIWKLALLPSLKQWMLVDDEDPDDMSQWACSDHLHLQARKRYEDPPKSGLSTMPRAFTKALEMRSSEMKVEKIIVVKFNHGKLDADESGLTCIDLTSI